MEGCIRHCRSHARYADLANAASANRTESEILLVDASDVYMPHVGIDGHVVFRKIAVDEASIALTCHSSLVTPHLHAIFQSGSCGEPGSTGCHSWGVSSA